MATTIKQITKLWIDRHDSNVRTAKTVEQETLTTIEFMIKQKLCKETLRIKAFVEASNGTWKLNEDGTPVGINKAKEADCSHAFAWQACQKQLSKYEFNDKGFPIVKDDKPVKVESGGNSFIPSDDQFKRAKAVGIKRSILTQTKSKVDCELLIQRTAIELELQTKINILRPNITKSTLGILQSIFSTDTISVNLPDVMPHVVTKMVEQEVIEQDGEAEVTTSVADIDQDMKDFELFMKFKKLQNG